jgi:hypothetical protein
MTPARSVVLKLLSGQTDKSLMIFDKHRWEIVGLSPLSHTHPGTVPGLIGNRLGSPPARPRQQKSGSAGIGA